MLGLGVGFSKEEPLRLEGLDVSLRGRRTLLVGSPEMWLARLAQMESEALYKGRSILVIQEQQKGTGREWPSLMRRRWDVVFRVRESFEAQMLATYVQNAQHPVRIVWVFPANAPTTEIPRALWQRWQKSDVSLLGCTEEGHIGGVEWESIFFPLACEQKKIERILGMRGSGIAGQAARLKDHLEEIASSGAAVAWTCIEETDARGSLYWYDASENEKVVEWEKEEAGAVLESLAKWLRAGR